MKTEICKRLGIEFPIFAFSHCRDVVAAVSNAGGFGVLGAVGFSAEQLRVELDWLDEHVTGGYGVDIVIPGKYVGMGEMDVEKLQAMLAAVLDKWKGSPETVSALQRAQSLWEESYNADVAARFAEIEAARARGEWVGTAYVSAYSWYEARLTRARTRQLCEFLRGAAYGERSHESCEALVLRAQANN